MNIKIEEPWWGAWKKFGWADKIWGVGFKKKMVLKAIEKKEKIKVKIWKFKETYEISPVTIRNYARKNRTIHLARHNTVLYIVPSILLRKEKND